MEVLTLKYQIYTVYFNMRVKKYPSREYSMPEVLYIFIYSV